MTLLLETITTDIDMLTEDILSRWISEYNEAVEMFNLTLDDNQEDITDDEWQWVPAPTFGEDLPYYHPMNPRLEAPEQILKEINNSLVGLPKDEVFEKMEAYTSALAAFIMWEALQA